MNELENEFPNIVLETENQALNQNDDDRESIFGEDMKDVTPISRCKSKETLEKVLSDGFNFEEINEMRTHNLTPTIRCPINERDTSATPFSIKLKSTMSRKKSNLGLTLKSNQISFKKSQTRNSSKLAMMMRLKSGFSQKRSNRHQNSRVVSKGQDIMDRINVLEKTDHNVNQKRVKTSLLKKILFTSTNSLFDIAKRRKILRQDIGNLPAETRVKNVLKKFERIYYKEIDKSDNIPLWKAIYNFQKTNLIYSIVLRILSDLIMVATPLVIRVYSKNLRSKSGVPILKCTLFLVLIPLMILAQNLLNEHSTKYICQCKSKIGQALRGLLYKKLVNADYYFLLKSDQSFLSRLIFFEFKNILDFIGSVPPLISSPVAIMFSSLLVIYNLSDLNIWLMMLATFSQISLFLILLNWLNLKAMNGRQNYYFIGGKISIKIQELISNIEMIRVNNFQEYFLQNFFQLRLQSQEALGKVNRAYSTIEFILILTPFIFSCVITTLYSIFSSEIEIETGTTLTIISMMVAVTVPLRAYSDGLLKFRIFQVAYSCTNKFFEIIKEKRKDYVYDDVSIGEIKFDKCKFITDKGITVKKVSDAFSMKSPNSGPERVKKFTIIKSSANKSVKVVQAEKNSGTLINANIKKAVIKDVSFHVRQGEKICVIGREGSGKDDLFLSIISELELIRGIVSRRGKVAYLNMKNPSFLKATIRENITLGAEFDKDKFVEILEIVGLNLDKYNGRDLTEIVEGERNISKQDKKKVLLARLLYTDAEIMLINLYFDQMSKDQQQPVFEKIVRKYLKSKTVIYTSDVNLLVKLSDRIFVFRNGQLVEDGEYDDLIKDRDSHMYKVIMTDNTGSSNFFGKILEGLRIYPKEMNGLNDRNDVSICKVQQNRVTLTDLSSVTNNNAQVEETESRNDKMSGIINKWMRRKLDRIRGKNIRKEREIALENKSQSFLTMFTIGGKKRLAILLLLFFLTNISLVSIQFWMAFWVTDRFTLSYSTYFYSYVILFFLVSVCVITRQIFFTHMFANNLTRIYFMGIESMITAKKLWFNQNPSSRIVYLLTKDQMVTDYDLIRSVFIVMDTFVIIFIIFLTLNYFYLGLMLVICFLLCYVAKSIYDKFQAVSSRLLAFDTKSRAEMIDIYLELFENLVMLRNFGRDKYFDKSFGDKTNEFQMSNTSLNNHSMRWLNIRITFFSMLAIFVIMGLPLISKTAFNQFYLKENWELTYAANVGPFLITYVLNFSRFLPKMSLNILSLQRIFHFIFDLAQNPEIGEGQAEVKDRGSIPGVMTRLSKRFRGSNLRHKRVNFCIFR